MSQEVHNLHNWRLLPLPGWDHLHLLHQRTRRLGLRQVLQRLHVLPGDMLPAAPEFERNLRHCLRLSGLHRVRFGVYTLPEKMRTEV